MVMMEHLALDVADSGREKLDEDDLKLSSTLMIANQDLSSK